jgi:hypothetical protein
VVSLSAKPRTWTLIYTGKFGPTHEGRFTDKARAVEVAQKRSSENGGVPVRVSTKGHFGSLTIQSPPA